jgi:protein TonB
VPEPEAAEEAPPGEQLGLDAEGVAGGDAFGLAARRGGSDIIGGGGGAAFAWYTGMIKDGILDALSQDERVRTGNYRLTVRVWLASDGRVERIALADSTGDPQLDAAIEQALTRVRRLREAPPLEMPQPVTLRIVSRS